MRKLVGPDTAIGSGLAGLLPVRLDPLSSPAITYIASGLKSRTQWNDYCASGKKPADIPAAPQAVYAEAGWAGYGDWLNTGTVATHLRQYKSFKEARAYVHGLGLKFVTQWRAYCKSGKKPADIPAKPDRTYANDGWGECPGRC